MIVYGNIPSGNPLPPDTISKQNERRKKIVKDFVSGF